MTDNYLPVQNKQRIISLDVIRGFAVLGILIMNIQTFALIFASYQNPTAFGDLTGINLLVWKLSHVLADTKFMTIFSLLFGAGIILMTRRLEEKGIDSKGLHYRRMMWLLIIGLLHAYFLWHGDILVSYSLIAMLAFLFRKKTVRTLTIVGLALILIPSLLTLLSGLSMPFWPEDQISKMADQWLPKPELINKELAAFQGSWWDAVRFRWKVVLMMQISVIFYFGWRILGLMLIGMALFRIGFLQAKLSYKKYFQILIICLIIGFALILYGMNKNFENGWDLKYSRFIGIQYNYWGSILVSLGYIAMLMIIFKRAFFAGKKSFLAPVGQMAFSNYLLQTIICTTIFYGYGFGYYGKFTRIELIIVVLAVWIIEIFLSAFWLRHYKYGPFEWLWRSLSYRKLLSIKKIRN